MAKRQNVVVISYTHTIKTMNSPKPEARPSKIKLSIAHHVSRKIEDHQPP